MLAPPLVVVGGLPPSVKEVPVTGSVLIMVRVVVLVVPLTVTITVLVLGAGSVG